jgi:hypothetical protein
MEVGNCCTTVQPTLLLGPKEGGSKIVQKSETNNNNLNGYTYLKISTYLRNSGPQSNEVHALTR